MPPSRRSLTAFHSSIVSAWRLHAVLGFGQAFLAAIFSSTRATGGPTAAAALGRRQALCPVKGLSGAGGSSEGGGRGAGAQLDDRDTFLGVGSNRLVRWDQRAREGVVQDALSSPSVVGYAGGKDYARNTNFSCMATSGACCPISPFRRIRFFHDKYRPMMRPPARLSSREHARVAVSVAAAAAGVVVWWRCAVTAGSGACSDRGNALRSVSRPPDVCRSVFAAPAPPRA